MLPPRMTRRGFASRFAGMLGTSALARRLPAQTGAHADVATMERARILADAARSVDAPLPTASLTGRRELQATCRRVANLCAAWLVSHDVRFAAGAARLAAGLCAPGASLLSPSPAIADPTPSAPAPATGVLTIADLAPMAEMVRSFSFLTDTEPWTPALVQATDAWCKRFLEWLTTERNPVLARDTKDHNASAWLLLTGAVSRAQREDRVLDDCRHRFRKPTLRNQIGLNGVFPHEVATETPFRNSLLNFDLLGGCAQLLASPFDELWSYELIDGTSLRSAVAYLYPSLEERHNWKYLADPQFFRDLPGRRPALLFAGRAYNRPEYVQIWQTAPAPDFAALPEAVAASFPISEPLLFTARAPHGF